ncbi:MAG TPA: hypothetical protein VFT42_01050, partial [Solirubrobacteraceae bacterium]|nr:hypothetical protein [Solirubrobacteraceae bacterium]
MNVGPASGPHVGASGTLGALALARPPRERLADPAFRALLVALAAGVLVLLAWFLARLASESQPALSHEGVLGYAFGADWDPAHSRFGAWPLLLGTLASSAVALAIGVPV